MSDQDLHDRVERLELELANAREALEGVPPKPTAAMILTIAKAVDYLFREKVDMRWGTPHDELAELLRELEREPEAPFDETEFVAAGAARAERERDIRNYPMVNVGDAIRVTGLGYFAIGKIDGASAHPQYAEGGAKYGKLVVQFTGTGKIEEVERRTVIAYNPDDFDPEADERSIGQ